MVNAQQLWGRVSNADLPETFDHFRSILGFLGTGQWNSRWRIDSQFGRDKVRNIICLQEKKEEYD